MLSFRRTTPRAALLAVLAAVSCNDDGSSSDDSEREPPPTSVVVRPSAFLGTATCGEVDGSLSRYQVTLYDVTDLELVPKALPSSPVVSCRQDVAFHGVEAGNAYIAEVSAYDRLDARAKSKGSSVVVDASGKRLDPAWATTCWGYDGVDYGLGGAAGAGPEFRIGVLSVLETEVFIGGCDSLSGDFPPELTGLSLDITHALGGLSCGAGGEEISRFRVILPGDEDGGSAGGAGGMAGGAGLGGLGGSGSEISDEFACGEVAFRTGLVPGTRLTFLAEAFQGDETSASYRADCRANVRRGVISPATCDPLAPID